VRAPLGAGLLEFGVNFNSALLSGVPLSGGTLGGGGGVGTCDAHPETLGGRPKKTLPRAPTKLNPALGFDLEELTLRS
jgi:hypothetical protein